MNESWMWLVTAASIAGTVANLYKKRWCFYVWGATNAIWAVYDFWLGVPSQGALMCVYFALALWGIYQWRQET